MQACLEDKACLRCHDVMNALKCTLFSVCFVQCFPCNLVVKQYKISAAEMV